MKGYIIILALCPIIAVDKTQALATRQRIRDAERDLAILKLKTEGAEEDIVRNSDRISVLNITVMELEKCFFGELDKPSKTLHIEGRILPEDDTHYKHSGRILDAFKQEKLYVREHVQRMSEAFDGFKEEVMKTAEAESLALNHKAKIITSEFDDLREKLNLSEKKQKSEIGSLKSSLEAVFTELNASNKKHTREINSLNKKHTGEINSLKSSLETVSTELTASNKKHTGEINSLNKKHTVEINSLKSSLETVSTELTASNKKHTEEINSLNKKHTGEINSLKSSLETVSTELIASNKKHTEEINSLKSSLEAVFTELIASNKKHTEEINSLNKKHTGEINSLKSSLETVTAEQADLQTFVNQMMQQLNAIQPSIQVPEGWTNYSTFSYKYFDDDVTFENARKTCAGYNAHVVDVQNENEMEFVMGLVGTARRVWLGLTDKVAEGTWVWERTGAVAQFLNWHPGEPNSWGGGEDCVIAGHKRPYDKWVDYGCGYTISFVCKK